MKAIAAGKWSDEEHKTYEEAVKEGLSWKEVARRVGTRSETQCRSHHQKMKVRKLPSKMKDKSTQYESQLDSLSWEYVRPDEPKYEVSSPSTDVSVSYESGVYYTEALPEFCVK
ncbi:unnamed protein product [Blepharisma stoltei]|uniref:Uncharacterized protein n=1 Tax=Blepharisma stoltei TaxID=1481888 RepID=A0AAU9IU71_9CILI|nr:unnamed protein product [Blepharisma stoltei]